MSKPKDIAKRAEEAKLHSVALSDHGSVSGVCDFWQAFEKSPVKPIMGNEMYIAEQNSAIKNADNRKLSHLLVLAKNHAGWIDLIRASSASNDELNFYYRPRLDLESLKAYSTGNWIIITGHPGSTIANKVFGTKYSEAYGSKTVEQADAYILPNAEEVVINELEKYKAYFGEAVYLEVQLFDEVHLPAARTLANLYRRIAERSSWVKLLATADPHYAYPEDYYDHRVILCKSLKTTLNDVEKQMRLAAEDEGEAEFGLAAFFRSKNYYIPTASQMAELHAENPIELVHSIEAAEQCTKYSIFNPPQFPRFPCADGQKEIDRLRELCVDGWKRIAPTIPLAQREVYGDRVKMELGVIEKANLAGYFLVVHDYTTWATKQGAICDLRGSGAGSLVCHLLGLSLVDPIIYDLLFSRFYNDARNQPPVISFAESPFEKFS